jgi:hypothetical protein
MHVVNDTREMVTVGCTPYSSVARRLQYSVLIAGANTDLAYASVPGHFQLFPSALTLLPTAIFVA